MPLIAIDARMITASGIGVYLRNIISRLFKEHTLVLLGDEDLIRTFYDKHNVDTLPCHARIYSLQEQIELSRQIPSCDLFWSPHYNIPLLPIPAKKRVVTIHDTYHLAFRHTLSFPQKVFANVFLRQAVMRSNQIITVSEFSKAEIVKYTHAKSSKVQVIPNAVDFKTFHANKEDHDRTYLAGLLPQLPEHYILYVGNVKPHKNITTLLKAYLRLPEALKQKYKMVIVGQREGFLTPDHSIAELFTNCPELERQTFFTGFVPEEILALLYRHASLFVFPSIYEGFGLPPLEAMASGCPVVASNAASIPEICGPAALYFSPLSIEELRQQIEKVLGNAQVQQALIETGLAHCQEFSWQKAANQHIALFNQILSA